MLQFLQRKSPLARQSSRHDIRGEAPVSDDGNWPFTMSDESAMPVRGAMPRLAPLARP